MLIVFVLSLLKKALKLENFLLDFLSKKFGKSEDQLHQIWTFYDRSFSRYNISKFPHRKVFPLKKFCQDR